METRTWHLVFLLAAVCVPLILAEETTIAATGSEDSTDSNVPEAGEAGEAGGDEGPSTEEPANNLTDSPSSSLASGTVETPNSVLTNNSAGSPNLQEGIEEKYGTEEHTSEFPPSSIVTKKDFDIMGVQMKSLLGRNFSAFCGIPYAEPPLGNRRFKAPVRMTYDGTIDATKCEDTPVCMQVKWHTDSKKVFGEEDCLYLNVYEPEVQSTNMPVIVYFHGGGFYSGSGTFNDAGPQYLMDQDVVLVTVNYRLGPLGFFCLNDRDAPGNMGMYDQVMALQWVRKYITHFHGDRFRVTIMGEGAGGASTHLHLFSQMTRGLFSRAISQTGVAFNTWALMKDMVNASLTHATILGCHKDRNALTMKCMRGLNASEIVESTAGLHFWNSEPLVVYRPTVQEGRVGKDIFLKKDPLDLLMEKRFHNVPWLVGIGKNPGKLRLDRYFKEGGWNVESGVFNDYMPAMLEMHTSIPDPEVRQQAITKIKEAYKPVFQTEGGHYSRTKIKEATKHENPESNIGMITQIFNDREWNLGHMLAVTYHALVFHENLFQYRFESELTVNTIRQNKDASPESTQDALAYLLKLPDTNIDRSSKHAFQMMRKLTGIWTEFAATGQVKALYRNKRAATALKQAQAPADTPSKGLLAQIFNKIFSRQRRADREMQTTGEPSVGEPNVGEVTVGEATVGDSSVGDSSVGEINVDQAGGVNASGYADRAPTRWTDFFDETWINKSSCWDRYADIVWPAVKRFPLTPGNVPMLPYLSFRSGEEETAVRYCLEYLMEFDSLKVWLQLPLKEVKRPDELLNLVAPTAARPETTTALETTKLICPTMPPEEVLPEITTESYTTWPWFFPNDGTGIVPGQSPYLSPGMAGQSLPPDSQDKTERPMILEPESGDEEPEEEEEEEVGEPETEPQPEPPPEPESQTVPGDTQPKYTWPQYPKPPEPVPTEWPQVDVDLPPLPTKVPSDSKLVVVKPTAPRRPSTQRQLFTWAFAPTDKPESPVQKPEKPQRPKPQRPKPTRGKTKSKAPPRSFVVWSYSSLVLLLLLILQF